MTVFTRRGGIGTNYDPWLEEQARADLLPTDEERNARYQQLARKRFGAEYDAAKYQWSAEPTTERCRLCYEWHRFPLGQRHFGYAWWRVCDQSCQCAHHRDENWIA